MLHVVIHVRRNFTRFEIIKVRDHDRNIAGQLITSVILLISIIDIYQYSFTT